MRALERPVAPANAPSSPDPGDADDLVLSNNTHAGLGCIRPPTSTEKKGSTVSNGPDGKQSYNDVVDEANKAGCRR